MISKYNKYLSSIFLLSAFFVLSSCDDSLLGESSTKSSPSRTALVSLNLSIAPESNATSVTRAFNEGDVNEGVDSDGYIKDVWLIEFDSYGKRIGEPQYLTSDNMVETVLLLPSGSDVFRLVAIANTHNSELFEALMNCNTLQSLANLNYGYDVNLGGCKDLVMNGVFDLKSGTTDVEMRLYRNFAKVKIDVTNLDDSGVTIQMVKLRYVAASVRYVDQLEGESATSYYTYFNNWNDNATSEVRYGKEEFPARKMSLIYYIPRNMKGTIDCDAESEKNINKPSSATFVEIIGKAAEGDIVTYEFYLGKNMKDNFDVEPNYEYVLPIVISGKGNVLDSRVNHFENNKTMKEANCYMIDYIKTASNSPIPQTIYTMTINRINQFWLNPQNENASDKYVLHQGDEWVAEVIWKDTTTDIFYFCDESGTKIMPTPHFYTSVWPDNMMRIKPTGYGSGNVLIGIRKKNANPGIDGYMWSYHLWITDYVPDYTGVMNDNAQYYPVRNGSVHRYNTDYWKSNLPASDGICVMDRNLGATSSDLTAGETPTAARGMSYQYGRKDPFPWRDIYLYQYRIVTNEDGTIKESQYYNTNNYSSSYGYVKGFNSLTTVANSVNHPNWMYGDYSTSWCDKELKDNWTIYDWAVDEDGNSLFDPAPEGWRMPMINEYYKNGKAWGLTTAGNKTPLIDLNGEQSKFLYLPYYYNMYVSKDYYITYGGGHQYIMCSDGKKATTYSAWNSINSMGSVSDYRTSPTRLIKQ